MNPSAGSGLDAEVIVVGTGFGGQCIAIKLLKAGFASVLLLERAETVGGTWRDNHYPGAACDIPSHLYSFSFELHPDWSRTYPAQPEIEAYLQRTARRYGLLPLIRFNTEVHGARFDAATGTWTISTSKGIRRARFLVLATGGLSTPAVPALPGMSAFTGKTFHSAQWDHSYTLAGQRVAVIGTGASAIQFVPRIAPAVGQLKVFQRTAPWIVPRQDQAYSKLQRLAFRWLPGLMRLRRWQTHWINELTALGTVVDPKYLKWGADMALKHLQAQVADPQLRQALTPDYVMGCKRILISNDWYPALQRPNTELVTAAVSGVTADGITTADGRQHAVDAIIFGTGFQATDSLGRFSISGRGGQLLSEAWRGGAQAYLGASVAGFPNLFLITGPNTGLGHNSMVFIIEANADHIVGALVAARRQGARVVEVKREVQTAFNAQVQQRMQSTVWVTGCRSWYQDAETGKVTTLWPGFSTEYWLQAHRFRPADYSLLGRHAPAPAS
jgi:cation diffusion facilitator CzcD-associated flavoprotein CzcO